MITICYMSSFKILLISICLLVQQGSALTCDIIIAGGTLASLGAIIQSPPSLKICVIEPTDRIGGQLGDQGVWHIDFNWLYQQGYPDKATAYNPRNLHKFMQQLSSQCSSGDCWVSRNCFLYECVNGILQNYLAPRLQSGNLTIFYNSVVKNVDRIGSAIKSVTIMTHNPLKEDCRSADQRIEDWYTYGDSDYYQKQQTLLNVSKFVIEATQYGDVLVLSNAEYLQGTNRSEKCGQSIVFGTHEVYTSSQLTFDELQEQEEQNADDFSMAGYTVDQIWRYRRLIGKGLNPKVGQLTLQNWNGPGNDYRDGYLFLANGQFSKYDWRGGINYTTIREAESRSIRYHEWFKAQAQLPLELTGKYFKTCNGVSKLPYVRDGRRSVGVGGFLLGQGDVTGKFIPDVKLTATPFWDRIALGYYNMDIHSIKNCQYDSYPQNQPLPFFLPLRAFTNSKVSNLIVAGRAMAQQFYTSSATRTHVTELHSGVASIIVATYMAGSRINSTAGLVGCPECVVELQGRMRMVMPIQWTIGGKVYPVNMAQQEELERADS